MLIRSLLSAAAAAAVFAAFVTPSQDDPLKAADEAFERKEYAAALAGYRTAATLPGFEKHRDHVAVRIGLSLARLERWDEAMASLDQFTKEKPPAPGFATALLERGVIAVTMPHNVYEKDGKRTRGNWVQGATYFWTGPQDFEEGIANLDRAAEVFQVLLDAATPDQADRKRLGDALIRARLELAAALESGGAQVPPRRAGPAPESKPATPQDRMIAAFDAAIGTAERMVDREMEALARYLKGAACVRLMHLSRFELRDGQDVHVLPPDAASDAPLVKLPADRNPLAVLLKAAERAAGTRLAAETLTALATLQERLGLFVDAVRTCQAIVKDHDKSAYAADARQAIERITFPRVALEPTTARLPGEPFEIGANLRNVTRVAVTVTRIPLDVVYGSEKWLEDPETQFGDPKQTHQALARMGASLTPVANVEHATGDDGLHKPLEQKIRIPALDTGGYLVEARSGEVVWRSLVLVSDLSVATKLDRDRIVVFAVDARSGQPVPGARVIVRQKHHENRRVYVRHRAGVTDGKGLSVQDRDFDDRWSHVECFASAGARMAIVDRAYWYAPRGEQERTVAYVMTDRPVYRPGDPIRIAAVLRQHLKDLDYQALANRSVRMIVRDPKGQQVFDQRLKTDATGAFSQELVLGKDAPLGVWHVKLERDGDHVQTGQFRIEEYLKPEFEVTVALPKEQVRLGSKVPVTIEAAYYFGGGVPGAEVTWRVFREEYVPRFSWRRHWMFGDDGDARRQGGGRELVVSGQGSTGSEGRLEIAFDTAAYASVAGEGSNFVVEADVMDASRRTLSGSATLLLAKRALVLGVEARRGFYMAGDVVECETQSRLPTGPATAASGAVKVYRITTGAKPDGTPDETRTLIHEEPHATDAKGIGFFRWQPDAGGLFAIAFEALDRFEQTASGEARLWVYKPGDRYRDFAFANLELVPDRRTFEPGQVAKILVKSALPEGSVFYSVDAGSRMLAWDVLALDGRLGVIEVPIERGHVPNIHVHVLAVAGGRFFEDRIELFIPPDDRFLDVNLAFAKDPYRPGDTGDLVVTTRTSTGAPVAARLAVTVLDASILAIQSDRSQDIRQFFYGARRHVGTQRDSSAGLTLGGYLVHDVKWGAYDAVGALPAWYGPDPGFASMLLRGEGFGLRQLESWGREQVKGRRGGKGKLARDDAGFTGGVHAEAAGAPAPGARPEGGEERLRKSESKELQATLKDHDSEGEGATAPPKTRTDFRDSALWTADVSTDESGTATIKVPFPESLTTWRAKAWAWTGDTLVGQTTADVKTTKDVLVRLRAPRFFVEGDSITVAALVNNRTAEAQQARVKLTLDGEHLETRDPAEVSVEVPPNADRRVDWTVNVLKAGQTKIAAQAVARADSDALEMTYPVLEWGRDKVLARGAVLEGDAAADLAFLIPAERRVETTSLELSLQPSLALMLLDALPFLVDFPYGCTEQTASRFIPAAIVAKLLGDAGVTLEDIAAARGGVASQRARDHARVLTSAELERAVRAGIDRLASMQHADGGFGWWKDDRSSPYLTAYVLQGLLIGREADLPIAASMIDRAVAFLTAALPKEEQLEQAVFVAYVLARAGKSDAAVLERVFRNRDALSPYGKALLASAMKAAGRPADAALVLRNLADFADRDADGGTAHWKAKSRHWWWWWNNLVETNAAVLNAFVDVDPGHEIVRPLVKWLVTNRRGGRWTNTRDTAHSVLALARYAKASGELDPALDVEVRLNGGPPRALRIDKGNVWLFDGRILFGSADVPTGDLKVSIRTRGKGRLYASGFARFFTKEADITSAGNELFVERSYVLVRSKPESREVDGRVIVESVDVFEPLAPGAEIRAGDVVEVRLAIDARNDFDYLFFEDLKPAGFEPLEVKSGARHESGICSNVEYRDTRTAMFVTYLQQGTHTLKYRLRAEVPGTLRVLPARGEAMYAPDIAGTSASFRFTILDKSER